MTFGLFDKLLLRLKNAKVGDVGYIAIGSSVGVFL